MNAKRIFFRSALGLSLFALCGGFAACSDDDVVASAVDTKPLPVSDWKDTSYAPGDNFFMYCNGAYWKSKEGTGTKYSIFGLVPSETSSYIEENLAPKAAHLPVDEWRALTSPMLTGGYVEADHEPYARGEVARFVGLVESAQSFEALAQAEAQIIEAGGGSILSPSLCLGVKAENPLKYESGWRFKVNTSAFYALQFGSFAPVLELFGVDAEMAAAQDELAQAFFLAFRQVSRASAASLASASEASLEGAAEAERPQSGRPHPLPDLAALPQRAAASGEEGDGFEQLVLEELGNAAHYVDDPEATDEKFFDLVNAQSFETLKAVSACVATLDYLCTSPSACELFNVSGTYRGTQANLMAYIDNVGTLCAYSQSYYMHQVMFDESTHQAYLEMCEDFRSALSARIEKLDWMSTTTKAAAQEKLAAMTFFIGGPSE